jgi:hypothetical protein
MVLSEDMPGSASCGMIIPANRPRQAGLMRTSGIGKTVWASGSQKISATPCWQESRWNRSKRFSCRHMNSQRMPKKWPCSFVTNRKGVSTVKSKSTSLRHRLLSRKRLMPPRAKSPRQTVWACWPVRKHAGLFCFREMMFSTSRAMRLPCFSLTRKRISDEQRKIQSRYGGKTRGSWR